MNENIVASGCEYSEVGLMLIRLSYKLLFHPSQNIRMNPDKETFWYETKISQYRIY